MHHQIAKRGLMSGLGSGGPQVRVIPSSGETTLGQVKNETLQKGMHHHLFELCRCLSTQILIFDRGQHTGTRLQTRMHLCCMRASAHAPACLKCPNCVPRTKITRRTFPWAGRHGGAVLAAVDRWTRGVVTRHVTIPRCQSEPRAVRV